MSKLDLRAATLSSARDVRGFVQGSLTLAWKKERRELQRSALALARQCQKFLSVEKKIFQNPDGVLIKDRDQSNLDSTQDIFQRPTSHFRHFATVCLSTLKSLIDKGIHKIAMNSLR